MKTNLRIITFICLHWISAMSLPAIGATTEPFGGQDHAIPGKIEAEHYDQGEPDIAYRDVDANNHGVDYRGPTQVDIEKRSDASNGHGIG